MNNWISYESSLKSFRNYLGIMTTVIARLRLEQQQKATLSSMVSNGNEDLKKLSSKSTITSFKMCKVF